MAVFGNAAGKYAGSAHSSVADVPQYPDDDVPVMFRFEV